MYTQGKTQTLRRLFRLLRYHWFHGTRPFVRQHDICWCTCSVPKEHLSDIANFGQSQIQTTGLILFFFWCEVALYYMYLFFLVFFFQWMLGFHLCAQPFVEMMIALSSKNREQMCRVPAVMVIVQKICAHSFPLSPFFGSEKQKCPNEWRQLQLPLQLQKLTLRQLVTSKWRSPSHSCVQKGGPCKWVNLPTSYVGCTFSCLFSSSTCLCNAFSCITQWSAWSDFFRLVPSGTHKKHDCWAIL